MTAKRAAWIAQVDYIVAQPAGSDVGFSKEDIARDATVVFHRLSTWEILCEEVLDTTHPHIYYERAQEELRRRGISDAQFLEMRRFAWLTVGWLNFEKMAWDWCSLNENDIYRAIQWQFEEGWISEAERHQFLEFTQRHAGDDAASHGKESPSSEDSEA